MIEFITSLQEKLVRIVAAFVILLVGYILSIMFSKSMKKVLGELETDKLLKKRGFKFRLEKQLTILIGYLIMIVAFFMALNQLNVTFTFLGVLISLIIALAVIMIILWIREFIPNFVAYVKVKRSGQIKAGKEAKIGEIRGNVLKIELSDTILRTRKDELIAVPNSILIRAYK